MSAGNHAWNFSFFLFSLTILYYGPSFKKKKSDSLRFRPRWDHRWKPFTSSHNQKEDNNQSKINKQPEVPQNQPAWNSDNKGIKETVNQTNQTGAPKQRNMAQAKEQSKTPERELSDEQTANLSDGELEALVIKMLTELTELGRKMKGQMKTTQSEIK